MTKYNLAFTSPINPPHAHPSLSHMQVWRGLIRKCRRPQDFLAVLADCRILYEDANGMKRVMLFHPGMGPPSNQATETLTFHGQTTVRSNTAAKSRSRFTLVYVCFMPPDRYSAYRSGKSYDSNYLTREGRPRTLLDLHLRRRIFGYCRRDTSSGREETITRKRTGSSCPGNYRADSRMGAHGPAMTQWLRAEDRDAVISIDTHARILAF